MTQAGLIGCMTKWVFRLEYALQRYFHLLRTGKYLLCGLILIPKIYLLDVNKLLELLIDAAVG